MRIKPDWDLLSDHFQDQASVFIADVNCQKEEALCTSYHPGGTYPTILVFHPQKPPELYQGGRGFDDLRKFVDENLVVPCNVQSPEETCSPKAQGYIRKWSAKDSEKQQKELTRLQAMPTGDMTYELSKWMGDRIRILEQLSTTTAKDEL